MDDDDFAVPSLTDYDGTSAVQAARNNSDAVNTAADIVGTLTPASRDDVKRFDIILIASIILMIFQYCWRNRLQHVRMQLQQNPDGPLANRLARRVSKQLPVSYESQTKTELAEAMVRELASASDERFEALCTNCKH